MTVRHSQLLCMQIFIQRRQFDLSGMRLFKWTKSAVWEDSKISICSERKLNPTGQPANGVAVPHADDEMMIGVRGYLPAEFQLPTRVEYSAAHNNNLLKRRRDLLNPHMPAPAFVFANYDDALIWTTNMICLYNYKENPLIYVVESFL